MIPAKKEELVLENWTAQDSAVLIALQCAVLRRKKVARVKQIVPDELECIAVYLIGSGLCDRTDCGSRIHSILRGKTARLDFELLQGVRKRNRQVVVVVRIIVYRAVEHEYRAGFQAAGDGDGDRSVHIPVGI